MKKVAILALTSALLMLAFAVAPVLAIGPLKAVGKNPNVEETGIPTLAMMDVPSDNTFMWINNPAVPTYGLIFHDAKATTGQGRINNAIIVTLTTLTVDMPANPEAYLNKWVFFSTDPVAALGGKSVLWLFAEIRFGAGSGDAVVAEHPDGVFATWHFSMPNK